MESVAAIRNDVMVALQGQDRDDGAVKKEVRRCMENHIEHVKEAQCRN